MNLSDHPGVVERPAGVRMGAVDFVIRDLTEAISSGVVRVGERLPSEAALAARYSVSRAVVREVLRALDTRGMTTTRMGKGTFVIAERPTDRYSFGGLTATHLLEARPHIEVPAAGLAALRRPEAQLDELQTLVEAMEAETDDRIWTGLDSTFHLTIAEASQNPVFVTVLQSIRSALADQSQLLNSGSGRREQSDAEHRAIVAAIARSSAVEAEDAMAYHLEQVKELMMGQPTG